MAKYGGEPKRIKISIFGDSTVGKTAIINSILGLEISLDMIATVSDDYQTTFQVKNNEKIKLYIYDYSGNLRFRNIALSSLKYIQGFVIIFDLTNKKSFDNLNAWLKEIREKSNNKFSCILFGNKSDYEKEKWEVTNDEALKFAKENGISYFETSAKTNKGINEGFSYLINEIYDGKLKENEENQNNGKNNKININNNSHKNLSNNSDCIKNKKKKNNK